MKQTLIKAAAVAAVGAAAALAPVTSQAEEIKYASAAPPNSPWANIIQVMIDNAAEKTGGSLVITPFLGGQLGDEPTVIQQVARGRVDMGGFGLTAVSLVVPELDLLQAPFLWDSLDQAECALDNHLITAMQPVFAKRGLVNLGWGEVGYQTIFAKEPKLNAADYKELKLRVAPASSSVLAFKAAGANGVVLPPFDINPSLQTGLVDAAEINVTFGVLTGVGQQAPHVNLTNHIYQPSLTVMSIKTFDKLPEAEREALLVASMPVQQQRATLRGVQASLTKKLESEGGQFHEMNPGERDLLKAEMTKTWPALVESIGEDAPVIWDEILKAKAACTN